MHLAPAVAPAPGTAPLFVAASVILSFSVALSLLGLHGVDYGITRALNRLSGRYFLLDHVAHDLTKEAFSNLPMMALIWFVWCRTGDDQRAGIVSGVLVSILAIVLCYLLQVALPHHLRPLHDPALRFLPPPAIDPRVFSPGMSFPSEHAAMLFALATTIYTVLPPLGLFCLVLASVLSAIRVYLGFHFPTDVVTGAMIGIVAVGMGRSAWMLAWSRRMVAWARSHLPLFCVVSFYLCAGISRMFEDYRYVAVGISRMLKAHLPH